MMFRSCIALLSLCLVVSIGLAQKQPAQTWQKSQPGPGEVLVHGYTTKNGKYVPAHYRKKPTRRNLVPKPPKPYTPKPPKLPSPFKRIKIPKIHKSVK